MAQSTFNVRVALDAATLLEIKRMADFDARSYLNMEAAMYKSLDNVEQFAQDWMWTHFIHPTGPLEEAFEKTVVSADLAILENISPYGQRRNYGFSKMTDALGRYYPYDPGIKWAENAVKLAIPYVSQNVWEAINRTLVELAV